MEKMELIEPVEGSNMHLDHHKQINIVLYGIFDNINKIQKELDGFKKIKPEMGEIVESNINKIQKELDGFKKNMEQKIDDLLSRIEKPIEKEVIIKEYSGILDTEKSNMVELEGIEFSRMGKYKVDVVGVEVEGNDNVVEYLMPQSDIRVTNFIPKIGIKSNGGKAIIQYKFKVLAYEI